MLLARGKLHNRRCYIPWRKKKKIVLSWIFSEFFLFFFFSCEKLPFPQRQGNEIRRKRNLVDMRLAAAPNESELTLSRGGQERSAARGVLPDGVAGRGAVTVSGSVSPRSASWRGGGVWVCGLFFFFASPSPCLKTHGPRSISPRGEERVKSGFGLGRRFKEKKKGGAGNGERQDIYSYPLTVLVGQDVSFPLPASPTTLPPTGRRGWWSSPGRTGRGGVSEVRCWSRPARRWGRVCTSPRPRWRGRAPPRRSGPSP